ncbi:MAG TPA: hypothetical protein PKH33_12315 [bacterium]|nr:hypothetical protein [bacterium]
MKIDGRVARVFAAAALISAVAAQFAGAQKAPQGAKGGKAEDANVMIVYSGKHFASADPMSAVSGSSLPTKRQVESETKEPSLEDRMSGLESRMDDIQKDLRKISILISGFAGDYPVFKTETAGKLERLSAQVGSFQKDVSDVEKAKAAALDAAAKMEAMRGEALILAEDIKTSRNYLSERYEELRFVEENIGKVAEDAGNKKQQIDQRYDAFKEYSEKLNDRTSMLADMAMRAAGNAQSQAVAAERKAENAQKTIVDTAKTAAGERYSEDYPGLIDKIGNMVAARTDVTYEESMKTAKDVVVTGIQTAVNHTMIWLAGITLLVYLISNRKKPEAVEKRADSKRCRDADDAPLLTEKAATKPPEPEDKTAS